jgi:hypothetical protein
MNAHNDTANGDGGDKEINAGAAESGTSEDAAEQVPYKVGYRRPPKHTQFQKGQSGNVRGRPRGRKNTKTIILEAAYEPIEVTVNGRRKKMPKIHVAVAQLVNDAVKGDRKATEVVLGEVARHETPEPEGRTGLKATDQEILARLKARFSGNGGR